MDHGQADKARSVQIESTCKWVFVFGDGREIAGAGLCRGGEMHLQLSPGTDICRQGQWAPGSTSLSCPASNNGSQQPPPPHITHVTHHTRVTRITIQNIRENWYKYQKKSVCGDPLLPLLQTPRWHLFLLAAHLRQNFFQTFFVVKTQPAGGVWVPLQVLLTHVSIFREGCLFLSLSSLAQPIFYGSYLQVLMKIVSTYTSQ